MRAQTRKLSADPEDPCHHRCLASPAGAFSQPACAIRVEARPAAARRWWLVRYLFQVHSSPRSSSGRGTRVNLRSSAGATYYVLPHWQLAAPGAARPQSDTVTVTLAVRAASETSKSPGDLDNEKIQDSCNLLIQIIIIMW